MPGTTAELCFSVVCLFVCFFPAIQQQTAQTNTTAMGVVAAGQHTLDNSLLNVPIGMSIGCGMAYRYLLTPSISMRICPSIPIAWTNRSREIGTIGYCSQDRCVNPSIDTYSFDQWVLINRHNRLLFSK